MNDTPPAPDPVTAPPRPRSRARRLAGWVWRSAPTIFALAGLGAGVWAGQAAGWKPPKASALAGAERREVDDWCKEHNVPESICVECDKDLLPRPPRTGWCKEFGVHDCP